MLINPLTQLLPATVAMVALTLYTGGVAALRGTRSPWPATRSILFGAGVLLIVVALIAPGIGAAGHDPRAHMVAHLLLGMIAPLLIALSAPVTLALRVLRPRGRRRLAAVLASAPVRTAGHPFTALGLSTGGLYVLYLTPLHAAAMHDPALGLLVALHVVLAGTLFAWAVVGVDHVPRRPSVTVRGAALVVGIALHTLLSRMLFADVERLAAQAGGSVSEWRTAAEIMWFEGDLLELALLAVFVSQIVRARRASGGRDDTSPPATIRDGRRTGVGAGTSSGRG